MAKSGTPFGQIEDAIEATDLTSHEKSALWMLGWSLLNARTQQAEAEARLLAVGSN